MFDKILSITDTLQIFANPGYAQIVLKLILSRAIARLTRICPTTNAKNSKLFVSLKFLRKISNLFHAKREQFKFI